jgi:hypothetical protein
VRKRGKEEERLFGSKGAKGPEGRMESSPERQWACVMLILFVYFIHGNRDIFF